ncbi:MAG: hypothetical protein HY719_04600 [Planctomycetes bacterium]|nr:hypothetical protein [Planctomycetota bacterium]
MVDEARAKDAFFSKVPKPVRSVNQQVAAARRAGSGWVKDLIGTWPGDETEAELLAAFKEYNG